MIKNKLWTHYERLETIIGIYITLFLVLPFVFIGINFLIHSSDIDVGSENAIVIALSNGMKWYGIIISIVTVIFVIWFLFSSSYVEFTDDNIVYFNRMFLNRSRKIPYSIITQIVFCDGLWKRKGKYYHGRKIIIFNKNNVVLIPDISPKLCLEIILTLPKEKIWLVNDDCCLRRIEDYFKIDFWELSSEQQFEILKYYCKITRTKYKTGNEILKIKK